MSDDAKGGLVWLIIIVGFLWILSIGSSESKQPYAQGDLSNTGGTPTYRYEDTPTYEDDPETTNDESNDQQTGYYGTETVEACSDSSGNCYDLDADFSDGEVERLYFPKGGWVDIDSSDCSDGSCYLEDEDGNEWEVNY